MSTEQLLQTLFSILEDSPHYFVSGSMSFLPLLDHYRQPGADVDVSIRKDCFEPRRERFAAVGHLRALRLSEVAVANASVVSRVVSPRTGFIHIETINGLLDTSLYLEGPDNIELILGLGLTLSMSKGFMGRINQLRWHQHEYRAGPPEMMFVTKSVQYMLARRSGRLAEFARTKHHEDLRRMASIIDWDFAAKFLGSLRVRWNGRRLADGLDRRINPYRAVDLAVLRSEL